MSKIINFEEAKIKKELENDKELEHFNLEIKNLLELIETTKSEEERKQEEELFEILAMYEKGEL
ncbi:hypothetical protein ACAG39_01720 [Caldicellulosiruptoraceae bacterium PP1]